MLAIQQLVVTCGMTLPFTHTVLYSLSTDILLLKRNMLQLTLCLSDGMLALRLSLIILHSLVCFIAKKK